MRRIIAAFRTEVPLRSAVALACFCWLLSTVPSAAQIPPFTNQFGNMLSSGDISDLLSAGQRLYGQDKPDGAADDWFNPQTGNGGTVTLLGHFTREGMACRKVRYENRIARTHETRIYVANWCRTPAGVWKAA